MIHESSAIRTFKTVPEMIKYCGGCVSIDRSKRQLFIHNRADLLSHLPTFVANTANLGHRRAPGPVTDMSAWIINQAAQQLGARLNSPYGICRLMADGREERKFTLPSVSISGDPLDTARALFSAAKENNTGAFLVAMPRSDIYDNVQSPREFAAVVQAAAVMENWRGPLFLHGDGFRLDAAKVEEGGKTREIERNMRLGTIHTLLDNGFGSIDVGAASLHGRSEVMRKLTDEARAMVKRLEGEMGINFTVMTAEVPNGPGIEELRESEVHDILFTHGVAKVPELYANVSKYLPHDRRHALGTFKYEIWTMPEEIRGQVFDAMKAAFASMFKASGVADTMDLALRYTSDVTFDLTYQDSVEV